MIADTCAESLNEENDEDESQPSYDQNEDSPSEFLSQLNVLLKTFKKQGPTAGIKPVTLSLCVCIGTGRRFGRPDRIKISLGWHLSSIAQRHS